jgi:hypothetical protein
MLAFQIAAGHIVQIQALGGLQGTLAIQRLLNSGLLIRQPIHRPVQVILVKRIELQDIAGGMLLR